MNPPSFDQILRSKMSWIDKFDFFENMEQTEEDCIKAVEFDGSFLIAVKNQTERICLAAIKRNPNSFRNVRNQTVDLCIFALNQSEHIFYFVKIVDNPDHKSTLQNLKTLKKKQSLKKKISKVL